MSWGCEPQANQLCSSLRDALSWKHVLLNFVEVYRCQYPNLSHAFLFFFSASSWSCKKWGYDRLWLMHEDDSSLIHFNEDTSTRDIFTKQLGFFPSRLWKTKIFLNSFSRSNKLSVKNSLSLLLAKLFIVLKDAQQAAGLLWISFPVIHFYDMNNGKINVWLMKRVKKDKLPRYLTSSRWKHPIWPQIIGLMSAYYWSAY